MIIGITGTNGSGKGTVVDYLVQKGFKHYSVRAELIEEIRRRGLTVDRSSMREVANDLRQKNGPLYFDHLFVSDAERNGYQNILIESVRVLQSVQFLKSKGGVIIAVDADRKIRYERAVLRGSETDKVDFDTWVEQEEREWGNKAAHDMDVPGVMKLADYTLQNNGSLEALHAQVDEVLAKIQG
jgi:dephospho-CoA kinase